MAPNIACFSCCTHVRKTKAWDGKHTRANSQRQVSKAARSGLALACRVQLCCASSRTCLTRTVYTALLMPVTSWLGCQLVNTYCGQGGSEAGYVSQRLG